MTDQYMASTAHLSRGKELDCTVLFELHDLFERHRRRSEIIALAIRLVAYPVALASAVSAYVFMTWIFT